MHITATECRESEESYLNTTLSLPEYNKYMDDVLTRVLKLIKEEDKCQKKIAQQ